MKKNQLLTWACLVLALTAALFVPRAGVAADIDLYTGADNGGTPPNVLFFLDNTSNWSNNGQAWNKAEVLAKCPADNPATIDVNENTVCAGYVTAIFGTNTTLKQGQVEALALKLVLNELVCNSGAVLAGKVAVGIMLMNDQGTTDGGTPGPEGSGYIRWRVALMDAARCAVLTSDLQNMADDGTNPANKGPSSAPYDNALYEAFKYFGGWTNPAGAASATAGAPTGANGFGPVRHSKIITYEDPLAFTDLAKTTYKSPITEDNTCGANYIVLVGNTWPNQAGATNANTAPWPRDTNLNTRLAWPHQAQFYPVPLPNSQKSNVRFADEWAKFLYTTDVSDQPGIQNLRMFTIDVYNSSADAKQGALLKSMADQSGPGGYFTVGGDLYKLINAFKDILTQIAAVNSVFASASLPVAVNAQGTFLNQVFMGVFRPDAEAQQRWAGNLKQYQFAIDGPTSIILVDKAGKPAVDSKNTGFIDNCATSFWTSDNSYWTTIAGSTPTGCTTSPYSAFSDAPDGPLVERGGAGQRLRSLGHAARNIRTCVDASCSGTLQDFNAANVGSISSTLADWARGENKGDGSTNVSGTTVYTDYALGSTATRPTVHGEVVHSRPLAVNYGSGSTNDVVVFYGAGDGMLRAVNGNQAASDGNELWAFVAPEHWAALDRVRTNSPLIDYPGFPAATPARTPKQYFFDGSIGGYQERSGGAPTKVWIYPTMRRGGNLVYAFDVLRGSGKPGTGANQPTLLWKFGAGANTDEDKMGQSWSTPVAIRVKGYNFPLVVFGAGYDDCEDSEDSTACNAVTKGKGVYVMGAQNGPTDAYRFIGDGSGLDSSAGRFVADMTTVDVNADGYIDVIYAVDTRGNIWRINTSDPASNFAAYPGLSAGGVVADWQVSKIATVSDWSTASEKRKFMYAPGVVVLGTQVTVLVGSGDREKPLSSSVAASVKNRFYGIRDDVTNTGPTAAIGYGPADVGTNLTDLFNVTDQSSVSLPAIEALKGWFMDLSSPSTPYEQVVTTPLTIGGVTYFSTYQAKANDSTPKSCTNLGTGRGYQIDFQTGIQLPNDSGQLEPTTFITPGIPPSPVGGVVSIDGKSKVFCIGCPNPSPVAPKEIIPNVKKNRKPVYRFQRIDS